MSINDAEGKEEPLTFEEFVDTLVKTGGWKREPAEEEWKRCSKPVYLSQLEW